MSANTAIEKSSLQRSDQSSLVISPCSASSQSWSAESSLGLFCFLYQSSDSPIQTGNSSLSSASSRHSGNFFEMRAKVSAASPLRFLSPDAVYLERRNQISRSATRRSFSESVSGRNISRGGPRSIADNKGASLLASVFPSLTTKRRASRSVSTDHSHQF